VWSSSLVRSLVGLLLSFSLAKRSFINRYARAKGYGRRKTPGAETLLHYSRLFVYINVETLDTMRVCVRDIASHRIASSSSRRVAAAVVGRVGGEAA